MKLKSDTNSEVFQVHQEACFAYFYYTIKSFSICSIFIKLIDLRGRILGLQRISLNSVSFVNERPYFGKTTLS